MQEEHSEITFIRILPLIGGLTGIFGVIVFEAVYQKGANRYVLGVLVLMGNAIKTRIKRVEHISP